MQFGSAVESFRLLLQYLNLGNIHHYPPKQFTSSGDYFISSVSFPGYAHKNGGLRAGCVIGRADSPPNCCKGYVTQLLIHALIPRWSDGVEPFDPCLPSADRLYLALIILQKGKGVAAPQRLNSSRSSSNDVVLERLIHAG